MKILKFILLILAGLVSKSTYAQEPCFCPATESKASIQKLSGQGDFEEAERLCNELTVSETRACKMLGFSLRAELRLKQKNYEGARSDIDNSISLYKQSCDDTVKAGSLYLLMKYGVLANKKDSAVTWALECIVLCEKTGDKSLLSKAYGSLGVVLNDLGEHARALHYTNLGLTLALKGQDSSTIAQLYTNIAGTYGMLFDVNSDSLYLDSVVLFQRASLPFAIASKNRKSLLSGYTLLASTNLSRKRYAVTLLYCDSAIRLGRRGVDDKAFANAYQKKSSAHFGLRDYSLAASFADSALHYAQLIGQVDQIITALERVEEANFKLGRTEIAYRALQQITHLADSLESIETKTVIADLEQRYNKVKNEEQIGKLSKEAEISGLRMNLLIFIIVAIAILLLSILILFRQRSLKAKQQILETEQRLNRARMNPHFFFNALTSLQTFSLSHQNSDRVPVYLARYAKIMRLSLESTYNELVPVSQEIEFITGYLEIQKLMHPGKFEYEIDLSQFEDPDLFQMPSMIVQPFIENAVEHGFQRLDYLGLIQIRFAEVKGHFEITINDNGKAANVESKHAGYPSRATQIITDRLFLLEKATGLKSSFCISSGGETVGYSVKIELPLLSNEGINRR